LRRVGEALGKLTPRLAFKKVDSCLRGNPGAETEALLEALGAPLSVVAPAFPAMGRTTRQGVHLIHGVPVSDTEMGRDSSAPVEESRLPLLMGRQCRDPVLHVGLQTIREGGTVLAREVARLMEQGARHLTFDAEDQLDLDRIAALGLGMGALLVGSAGLARGVAGALGPAPVAPLAANGPNRCRPGHHLLVCGSLSSRSRAQVAALASVRGVRVIQAPAAALADPGQTNRLGELARQLLDALDEGDLAVTTEGEAWPGPGEAPAGTGPGDVAAGLGALVAEVATGAFLASLFLTGGDTARAVLHAMGSGAIRLCGEILPGMVLGTVMEGPHMGLPVVTKAGAFGGEDALVRWHDHWFGEA
jgi:uncharacterized protein YgbK (DUF1537 family)